jgi:hypothetical protein
MGGRIMPAVMGRLMIRMAAALATRVMGGVMIVAPARIMAMMR